MTDYSDLIGIPFVNGGRDLSGCDCWGLTLLAFKKHGINLIDYRISCFASNLIDLQVESDKSAWRKISEPTEPCLMVMRIDSDAPDLASHIGTYIRRGRFLHTMIKRNSVIERIDHPYFVNRIEGFYAYTG